MAPICPSGQGFTDHLLNFEFIKAFTCQYFDPVGLLVTGTIVYGAIALAIYIRTGSVIIPAILFLLTGGAVMTQLAGIGATIATLVLLTSGGGVIAYAYYRWSQ